MRDNTKSSRIKFGFEYTGGGGESRLRFLMPCHEHSPQPPVSPLYAGLLGRCPRCGKGHLFNGFLSVAERCRACGLDYSFANSGDGPAVFIILIAGFIVTGAALIVEVRYQPSLWLHLALWLPLGAGLPLLLLRPFKATFLALQYRFHAEEGKPADGSE